MALALLTTGRSRAASVTDYEATPSAGYPSYVRLVDPQADPAMLCGEIPDSLFQQMSATVVFAVNSTALPQDNALLRQLADDVLPRLRLSGMHLAGICLRGAASPEGPYDNNVRLSRGRAASLIDFVCRHLGQDPGSDVCTATVAEDYPYLVEVMTRAGDPDAQAVAAVVERGASDPRLTKRLLQQERGGALWQRLVREYFPQLRAARMVLMFRLAEPPRPVAGPDVPARLAISSPLTPAQPRITWSLPALPAGPEARPHMLSVGTNVVYDLMLCLPNYGWAPTPNVALEFYPRHGQWTFLAAFTAPYFHRWDCHKFYQIRDYHLEARRYFHPTMRHTGLYLAAYVNCSIYGIGFSATKGWQGEGIGGAVKVGYVLPLGGRWRVDFHAAAGVYWSKYDPYVYGNPVTGGDDGFYYYDYTGDVRAFRKRSHHRLWGGPTEVGITFTYDVLFWRKPGGVSFRSHE